jgi:hypothetical protein
MHPKDTFHGVKRTLVALSAFTMCRISSALGNESENIPNYTIIPLNWRKMANLFLDKAW